jgi:hypothetical protein
MVRAGIKSDTPKVLMNLRRESLAAVRQARAGAGSPAPASSGTSAADPG